MPLLMYFLHENTINFHRSLNFDAMSQKFNEREARGVMNSPEACVAEPAELCGCTVVADDVTGAACGGMCMMTYASSYAGP